MTSSPHSPILNSLPPNSNPFPFPSLLRSCTPQVIPLHPHSQPPPPGQIVEDGSVSEFQDATVKVLFFLHEQLESEGDEVARAFRLETQIVETDEYDVHMVSLGHVTSNGKFGSRDYTWKVREWSRDFKLRFE